MGTFQFRTAEAQILNILGGFANEFNIDAIVGATTTRDLDGRPVWTVADDEEFWTIVAANEI